MFKNKKSFITAMVCLLSFSSHASVIFSEDFSSGSSSLVGWSDNDGSNSSFEIYDANSAGVYNVSPTYDHDNDPLTPEILIPAGLEINDDTSDVTLISATFTLLNVLNSGDFGTLQYFSGMRRGNASNASVELLNVTQNFSLTGPITNILFNSGEWSFNSFDFSWGNTVVGDQLQVSWFGGGNSSANGQQIADITLFNNTALANNNVSVPVPSTLGLFGVVLIGAALRRRTFRG